MNAPFLTLLSVLLLLITVTQGQSCSGLWDYTNPDRDWPLLPCTQTCAGAIQSPVDVRSYVESPELKALEFKGYGETEAEFENLGYTVEVVLPSTYTASFVPDYNLVQFHFHRPAENKLNGTTHKMTMHLVHKNTKISPPGYKVLDILIEEVPGSDSTFLEPLVQALSQIPNEGDIKNITFVGLQEELDKLKAENKDSYVNFAGSLTTPPCTEGIDWYIFLETIKISTRQFNAFKCIMEIDSRPVQRNLTNVPAFIRHVSEQHSTPAPHGTYRPYGSYGTHESYGPYGSYGTHGAYRSYGAHGAYGLYGSYGAYRPYGSYGTHESSGPYGSYGTHGAERSYGTHGPYGTYGTHESSGTYGSYGTHGAYRSYGAHGPYGTYGTHEPYRSYGTHESSRTDGPYGSYGNHGAYGAHGTHGAYGTNGAYGSHRTHGHKHGAYGTNEDIHGERGTQGHIHGERGTHGHNHGPYGAHVFKPVKQ